MRRGIWIALLSLGTILGFGAGFARVCGYYGHGFGPGYEGHGWHGHGFFGPGPGAFEDRAADACVRAAERVLAERHTAPPPTPAERRAPAP